MEKSLLKVAWNDIDSYTDEDISYYLFMEGKSKEAICRIRNLNRETVEAHIIKGKIKFGIVAKSKDVRELFRRIASAGKQDKVSSLTSLDEANRSKLLLYIANYFDKMYSRDKEVAIWIIGECREKKLSPILKNAALSDKVNLRRLAVSAMGKMEDVMFEDALIACIEDENPQVVLYALKALVKLKSRKCLEKAEKVCKNSDKDYLKRAYLELANEVNS